MTRRRRRRAPALIWILSLLALAIGGVVAFWAMRHLSSAPLRAGAPPAAPVPGEEDFSAAERGALEGILKRQGGGEPGD